MDFHYPVQGVIKVAYVPTLTEYLKYTFLLIPKQQPFLWLYEKLLEKYIAEVQFCFLA